MQFFLGALRVKGVTVKKYLYIKYQAGRLNYLSNFTQKKIHYLWFCQLVSIGILYSCIKSVF